MARVCELSGKSRLKGNKVSHSNIKTRKFSMANLTKKKWWIPELKRSVTLTLSSSALRTIDARGGLVKALLTERVDNLSERLTNLRKQIEKARLVAIRPKGEEAQEKVS